MKPSCLIKMAIIAGLGYVIINAIVKRKAIAPSKNTPVDSGFDDYVIIDNVRMNGLPKRTGNAIA
ncbi:MAG: hypothetical protein IPG12_14120 [Saprospiraceae bacterium]|nr:hypothetical protein [Saprospiraceae bacterium]